MVKETKINSGTGIEVAVLCASMKDFKNWIADRQEIGVKYYAISSKHSMYGFRFDRIELVGGWEAIEDHENVFHLCTTRLKKII